MRPWKHVLILALSSVLATGKDECASRDYGNEGTVCVCTPEYCDSLPVINKIDEPQFIKYTSNIHGLRFDEEIGTFNSTNSTYAITISVNEDETYQTMYGWGGAFTDATGININSLSEDLQEQLLRAYFSEDGIEYSLCRVPIGGTDFSTHAYSYNDGSEDRTLSNFNLTQEDYKYKLPFIKRALNLSNNTLELFASAWTAPKWMKITEKYSGIFGFLKDEMYQLWADYFLKFLERYKEEGVEFWGITTGNEPSLAFTTSSINSVAWTPPQMQTWILNNLGPTIRNSNFSNIKIMALDDQRLFLPWYTDWVLKNEEVRNYVDGIAVHWYWDFLPASLLSSTHENFPEKFILATEACTGENPPNKGVLLGSWDRAEQYATSIIEDTNHWITGWVDWNMALDEAGGPTYIKNFVDSPIIVNVTGGEFYKQPMYYALGHFSKFIPRNSVKIYALGNGANMPLVAFKRPDNGIVLVILNKIEKAVPATLSDGKRGKAELILQPKSITTILYW